jgi:hypothetical protein
MAVFWVVALCSLEQVYRRFSGAFGIHYPGALMMEAVSTSETSVNFHQTKCRNIPEDSHLHKNTRRQNQKSHARKTFLLVPAAGSKVHPSQNNLHDNLPCWNEGLTNKISIYCYIIDLEEYST